VFILDTPDVAGALGYHDISSDVPYGKVFVKIILQSKGSVLSGALTVSSVVCHEVMELLVDPLANVWWMGPDYSTLYAAEVGDPVQANTINVTVGSTSVAMSDYILPAWADPQRSTGPFNKKNTLTGPFKLAKGGYAIVLKNSKAQYVLGESTPIQGDDDIRIQRRKGPSLVSLDNPSVPPVPTVPAFISPGATNTAVIPANSILVPKPPVHARVAPPTALALTVEKLTSVQRLQLARRN